MLTELNSTYLVEITIVPVDFPRDQTTLPSTIPSSESTISVGCSYLMSSRSQNSNIDAFCWTTNQRL